MANKLCTIEGCPSAPRFECKCQNPSLYYCDIHLLNHTAEGLTKSHEISLLFAKMSHDEYSFTRDIIEQIHKQKYKAINTMMTDCNQKIDQIKKFYSSLILGLCENVNLIIRKIENAILNQKLLQEDKFIVDLKRMEEFSKTEKNYELLLKMNKFPGSSDIRLLIPKDRFIYTPINESKKMIEINKRIMKKSEIEIQCLPENFMMSAGTCRFEDGDIFYCGGIYKQSNHKNHCSYQFTSSCYKIDPKTRKLEILEKIPTPIAYIRPICIGNSVYIFGGSKNTDSSLSSAWKYSIKQRQWMNLADMPLNSKNVSCVYIKDSILLSIQNSGIWKYDFSGYEKILNSTENWHRSSCLLKTASGQLFYLISGYVYESSEEDYRNWIKVGSYENPSCEIYSESDIREYKNYFIWIVENKLMRFNYKTFTLQKFDIN